METMTLDDYEEAMKTHFWAPSSRRWPCSPKCAPGAKGES
jgi:hypothetical protein